MRDVRRLWPTAWIRAWAALLPPIRLGCFRKGALSRCFVRVLRIHAFRLCQLQNWSDTKNRSWALGPAKTGAAELDDCAQHDNSGLQAHNLLAPQRIALPCVPSVASFTYAAFGADQSVRFTGETYFPRTAERKPRLAMNGWFVRTCQGLMLQKSPIQTTSHSHFSLATRRRTIHSGLLVMPAT